MEKISIGLINFINCLPINHTLEKWAHENIVLSWGHPVLLNQLVNCGQVQVAPVSAYEYLTNEKDYILIKEACITSDAECGSVILFSNHKFEDLAGKKIGIPHNSATSINMLKILLKESGIPLESINFSMHKYKSALPDALSSEFDAVLYIGDQALVSRYKYNDRFNQYDLGSLWKEATGLPPVFGTWVARADWATAHKDDFEWIKFLINKAVEAGLGVYFNEVIQKAASDMDLPEYFIEDYLTAKIKYNFTSVHEQSLKLFKEKIYEIC